jgi:hypothetical protein
VRQRGVLLTVAGIVLVVAILATSLVLAAISRPVRSIGAPASEQIQFDPPVKVWGANGLWYNFTISLVRGPITWNQTTIVVLNGSLWPIDENSSLTLLNRSAGMSVVFVPSHNWTLAGRYWTTMDAAPVEVGSVLSLEVDRQLTGGSIDLEWTGSAEGSYGWQPLP